MMQSHWPSSRAAAAWALRAGVGQMLVKLSRESKEWVGRRQQVGLSWRP
jgi:hypothetical protein